MKKKLEIIVAFILLVVLSVNTFALAATGSASGNVTITPSATSVSNGETFTITIAQECSDGIIGYESQLNYDTNLLTLQSIGSVSGWTSLGEGTKLEALRDDDSTSGNVFVLTFTVNSTTNTTTTIGLTNIKLYKTATETIDVADQSTTITLNESSSNTDTTALTGITMNQSSISLALGYNFGLIAYPNPTTATLDSVTWSSSNESIVKVQKTGATSATVIPVAAGKATVTATTTDGKYSASTSVTITSNGGVTGNTTNTNTNSTNTNKTNTNTNKTNTNTNTNNTNTNNTNTNNTNTNDTATSTLPKTGSTSKYVLLIVIGLIGIAFVCYNGYKKYKEI